MSLMNRLGNCKNPYQDDYKKVLCLCSAGLLRSPTTALVLSQEPFNFNTRAAGLEKEFALIPVDEVLLHWAEEIIVMTEDHLDEVKELLSTLNLKTPVIHLGIPDSFMYRDPELMKLIKERYLERTNASRPRSNKRKS